MAEAEIFPVDFYVSQGIPMCPNGDMVRSDDAGLFCIVEGDRVPYPVVTPVVVALVKESKGKKQVQEDTKDGNG